MTAPTVLSFFDNATKSYSHVVADEGSGACAVGWREDPAHG